MRFISNRPDTSVGGEIVRLALQAVAVHLDQVADPPGDPGLEDRGTTTDLLDGVSREERSALWGGEVAP